MKRQISSSLFERLALSQDKSGVLKLSEKGLSVSEPKDIIKDPYVLEFLQITEEYRMTERKRNNDRIMQSWCTLFCDFF